MLSRQDRGHRILDRWQLGKDRRPTIKLQQAQPAPVGTMMLHLITTSLSAISSGKMLSSTSIWATWPSLTLGLKMQDPSSLKLMQKLPVWAKLAAVRQIAAKTRMLSSKSLSRQCLGKWRAATAEIYKETHRIAAILRQALRLEAPWR